MSMPFIWSRDALELLLDHPSEDVRQWAIVRIAELYPDTAGRLLSLAPSLSADCALLILYELGKLEIPISQPEPLLNAFHSFPQATVRELAGALLLSYGHDLPPDAIKPVAVSPFARVVSTTGPGFERALRLYQTSDQDNEHLLVGMAVACNFAGIFLAVQNDGTAKELSRTRKVMEKAWGCRLPALEHFSKPSQVLPTLDEALAGTIPDDATPWKKELLAELEQDRQRLAAMRRIAGERSSRWSEHEVAFFRAAIPCLRRNRVCAERIAQAGDAAGLWKALLMKPWRGVPGPGLLEFTRSLEPQELVASLESALAVDSAGIGSAFAVLNALATPGRIKLFTDILLDKEWGDLADIQAVEALKKAGPPAADYLVGRYGEMSETQRAEMPAVLDSFPTPGVVDFFLAHFEDYMRQPDPGEFLDSLERVGSSAFLPALLREWRAGEKGIGGAIKLIAAINNIHDAKIKEAVREIPANGKSPEELLRQPVRDFAFRCRSCGRTYHYDLKRVYIGKDDEPYIGDIIQCKGCGTVGESELTPLGRLAITAEMARIVSLAEEGAKREEALANTPLKLGIELRAQALGREVKSANEAYVLMKAAVEKSPGDADTQRRMGNVLRNGGRNDLALPYLLETVRLNPTDADAQFLAADVLVQQEKYREAVPHLEALVPLLRDSKMDEKHRRDMFSEFLHLTFAVEKETGHRVDIFPRPEIEGLSQSKEPVVVDVQSLDLSRPKDFEIIYQTFRRGRVPPKYLERREQAEDEEFEEPEKATPIVNPQKGVGRNDPCPCGSGKKYKRCCGR
ncbi:MAG: SEC-C domain-containing protein [Chloroflexi bacterium]|nr:SEC-C domain-containing protein [Chloroflexota bacterium]